MPCLHASPIQIPSHEVERAWVGVPQVTVHLCEEIREADWRGVSGKAKEICEQILVMPGGGYEKDYSIIPLHLVQDLWEQGDG